MVRRLSRFQNPETLFDSQSDGAGLARSLALVSRSGADARVGPPQPANALAPFDGSVHLGSLGTDGIVIHAANSNPGLLGFRVADAGDVNGDGISDFIVTSSNAIQSSGAAYVIFGVDGGGQTDIFLEQLTPAEGFIVSGSSDRFGASLGGAGDVNNDGYDDIFVGAPGSLRAYLIFGKATGFANIHVGTMTAADGFTISNAGGAGVSLVDINDDGFADLITGNVLPGNGAGSVTVIYGKASGLGNIDAAALSPTDGFTISGVPGSGTGVTIADAGDINNDGIQDFMIGATSFDVPGANSAGAVYVLFGRTTGFTSFNLSTLSAADGFRLTGTSLLDEVGRSIDSAGDINNDGYDDIIVGSARGAYVVYGKATGFTDIVLDNITPSQGFSITGFNGAGFSVDGAGDVNGDGIDDLIVGATSPTNTEGRAFVLFGSASGLSNVDLSRALVATRGFTIFPDISEPSGRVGFSVSTAGDIDDDGIADLLVSAPNQDLAYVIYGRAGAGLTPIVGTPNADALFGTEAGDDIRGLGGNDYIEGGTGADQLAGGQGDDVYAVEEYADLVLEAAGEGNDIVYTYADYVLPTGQSIEALSARDVTATAALNLTGNALANTLVGSNGKNILDGGGGGDVLFGLGGDDRYLLRSASDLVFESAGGGQDVVIVNFGYQLLAGQSVETLAIENFQSSFAADLLGNELNNNIGGNAAANAIYGGAGDDGLFGYAGDDYLNGGDGIDYFEGGTGNDTFIVDNSAEVVRENIVDAGTDRIYTSASYTLALNLSVEILAALDNGATTALNLTGNNLANTILGNNGANVLSGNEGADVLGGFGGNDTLDGGSAADYLEGGSGNDSLDGGTGADYMVGGTGDDTYVVDNAGDVVVELPGEGNDTILTSSSYSLGSGGQIEGLGASDNTATTALSLSGNELNNTIQGNNGANALLGNDGADTLAGLGGDDFLDGGTGIDQMTGGTGNDLYIVDDAADVVTEAAGGGSDTVYSAISYTLGAGSEIEALSARDISTTNAMNLTGNEFANTILGNNGANLIDGKGGSDALNGFGGADNFAFTTALGAGNVDSIFGFSAADDTIALDDAIFTGLSAGALPAGAFVVGTAAADADDRIIYNSATGQLFFDADGNGAGAAIQFARLDGAPVITASDFLVI